MKQKRWIHRCSERTWRGASLRIYLPKVENAIEVSKPSTDIPNVMQGNETVLLVEDEASLRKLGRQLLELCGYRVFEAENGAEALKMWSNTKKRSTFC